MIDDSKNSCINDDMPADQAPVKKWETLIAPPLDEVEKALLDNFPIIDCPLRHWFPKGMYVREITMPAGAFITSKIHRFESPFTVSKGRVSVYTDGGGVEEIEAPYTGITSPGTRRALFIHEDTVWTTYHTNPDDIDDPVKMVEFLTEPHINPLIEGVAFQPHGLPVATLTVEETI